MRGISHEGWAWAHGSAAGTTPVARRTANLLFLALASVRVFFLLLEFPTVPRAASRPAEPVTANCRHLNFALASPHRPEGRICTGLRPRPELAFGALLLGPNRFSRRAETAAGLMCCTVPGHCREAESGAGTVRLLRRSAVEAASNEEYSSPDISFTVKVQGGTNGKVLF